MVDAASELLRTALRVPDKGRVWRVRKGELEVEVEHGPSGCVVRHNGYGGEGRLLGVPGEGELWLLARAPEFRLVVELTDPVEVVPGGRVRGYVAVPLPHRVVWRGEGVERPVLDILPRGMETSWLGEELGYEHRVVSDFYLADAVPGEPTMALLPLVLCNRSRERVVPAEVVVHLQDRQLHVVRGRIVAAPRRLAFTENGTEECVRWLEGGDG